MDLQTKHERGRSKQSDSVEMSGGAKRQATRTEDMYRWLGMKRPRLGSAPLKLTAFVQDIMQSNKQIPGAQPAPSQKQNHGKKTTVEPVRKRPGILSKSRQCSSNSLKNKKKSSILDHPWLVTYPAEPESEHTSGANIYLPTSITEESLSANAGSACWSDTENTGQPSRAIRSITEYTNQPSSGRRADTEYTGQLSSGSRANTEYTSTEQSTTSFNGWNSQEPLSNPITENSSKTSHFIFSHEQLLYCGDPKDSVILSGEDDHQTQISDHQTHISDHQTQISDPQTQISDHQTQISDHQTQISDHQTQISDHQTQISDHRTQISDHRTQISDHQTQISDREPGECSPGPSDIVDLTQDDDPGPLSLERESPTLNKDNQALIDPLISKRYIIKSGPRNQAITTCGAKIPLKKCYVIEDTKCIKSRPSEPSNQNDSVLIAVPVSSLPSKPKPRTALATSGEDLKMSEISSLHSKLRKNAIRVEGKDTVACSPESQQTHVGISQKPDDPTVLDRYVFKSGPCNQAITTCGAKIPLKKCYMIEDKKSQEKRPDQNGSVLIAVPVNSLHSKPKPRPTSSTLYKMTMPETGSKPLLVLVNESCKKTAICSTESQVSHQGTFETTSTNKSFNCSEQDMQYECRSDGDSDIIEILSDNSDSNPSQIVTSNQSEPRTVVISSQLEQRSVGMSSQSETRTVDISNKSETRTVVLSSQVEQRTVDKSNQSETTTVDINNQSEERTVDTSNQSQQRIVDITIGNQLEQRTVDVNIAKPADWSAGGNEYNNDNVCSDDCDGPDTSKERETVYLEFHEGLFRNINNEIAMIDQVESRSHNEATALNQTDIAADMEFDDQVKEGNFSNINNDITEKNQYDIQDIREKDKLDIGSHSDGSQGNHVDRECHGDINSEPVDWFLETVFGDESDSESDENSSVLTDN